MNNSPDFIPVTLFENKSASYTSPAFKVDGYRVVGVQLKHSTGSSTTAKLQGSNIGGTVDADWADEPESEKTLDTAAGSEGWTVWTAGFNYYRIVVTGDATGLYGYLVFKN